MLESMREVSCSGFGADLTDVGRGQMVFLSK